LVPTVFLRRTSVEGSSFLFVIVLLLDKFVVFLLISLVASVFNLDTLFPRDLPVFGFLIKFADDLFFCKVFFLSLVTFFIAIAFTFDFLCVFAIGPFLFALCASFAFLFCNSLSASNFRLRRSIKSFILLLKSLKLVFINFSDDSSSLFFFF
jgi:hypothetical protein